MWLFIDLNIAWWFRPLLAISELRFFINLLWWKRTILGTWGAHIICWLCFSLNILLQWQTNNSSFVFFDGWIGDINWQWGKDLPPFARLHDMICNVDLYRRGMMGFVPYVWHMCNSSWWTPKLFKSYHFFIPRNLLKY